MADTKLNTNTGSNGKRPNVAIAGRKWIAPARCQMHARESNLNARPFDGRTQAWHRLRAAIMKMDT